MLPESPIPFSRYHAIHKEVYKWFDFSFDEFGRTSSPQQTEVCQSIIKKLLVFREHDAAGIEEWGASKQSELFKMTHTRKDGSLVDKASNVAMGTSCGLATNSIFPKEQHGY